jgi:hypothetical protein
METKLTALVIAVLATGCCSPGSGSRLQQTNSFSIANPELRRELLARVEDDQAIAKEYYPKQHAGQLDAALISRRESSLSNNAAFVKTTIQRYGWPGPKLVGRDGSSAAFLLVQHSDHGFRKQMLPLVRKAYRGHKLSGQDYALLLDIDRVEDGKPQEYGTRLKPFDQWRNREPVPELIREAANVDKRRAEVGLLPLSLYLEDMKEARFPSERKVSFFDRVRQTPGGDLMLSAIDYLSRLKQSNELPGVQKGEHGTFALSGFTKPERFPVRRTETFTKENDVSSVYYYAVVKKSSDSEWRLSKAWRRDASGKIADRYCIKEAMSQ